MILGAAAFLGAALSAPAVLPPAGAAVARIEIPSIHLRAVVLEDTSTRVLDRGPGHYRGTKLPGALGTIGIAGHRTTHSRPFLRLNALREGDRVVLTTDRRYVYRVYRMRIVTPKQTWTLRSGPVQQVVLTACHPPGSDRYRLVVFAHRVHAGR